MVVSVDGLLERLGSRYQLLVFLLLSTCLTHVAINHHLHHYYLSTPPHHCKLPEGWKEEAALPMILIGGRGRGVSGRGGGGGGGGEEYQSRVTTMVFSRCTMYKDPLYHHKGTKSCVYGYVFTLRGAEWSVVAEWGLVCERIWIKHWIITSYLIGLVFGGLIFGFIADRFGRRNLLMVCVATVGCLGLALHFVRRLIVFLSLRFIQAIFVQGVYVTSWTLVAELFPARWRCRALVAAGMARPLGVALGALLALMVQHWRAIQLALSLPLLISLVYCWMVPESLRWLLTRGKTRRARQVAAQLARHNQLTLPPTAHAQMDHLAAHVYLDVPWGTLVTLFKTPRLRKHTLVLAFMWLAVSLADGGFRHNLAGAGQMSDLLGGPGHLGYLLGAGVEAGAVVLAVVLSTQLYRRAFLVLTLLLSAALSLAVICVLQLVKESWLDVTALATALRFMGVLIVGGARVGVGVVSVEVAPTTARASAVGLCAAHAAVGEILTPLLAIVAELTYPSVPWLMSAAGCLVAAMLALLLPETSGTSLPDVVDEAEVIGLCYRGDVLKTCDFGYGRSPYWVEVDGLIVSRSVSEAALEDDDKCRRLKPNVDSQLKTKVSERRDKKRNMIDEGAGPSKLMVPHVKSRRREISALFPGSSGSVASSCSHCSLVSLVDVSRINGNNSDTTDSNDFECRDKINKLSSVCGEETSKTEQNVDRSRAEGNEEINAKVPPEVKDHAAGKSSVRSKEGKTNTAANSDPSAKDNAPVYEAIPKANVSSTESVESDLSISVCSLQFKHIRRLVSPTDRRRKPGLQYSSSSVYAAGEGRTLVQEYMSRNSFKGDVSSLRYPTLASESKCAKNNEHESPITTPSSVLKECIRIARNRERITVLNRLQEEETDENASFQQDTNTVSSQASVFSTDTSESTDESVLRDSQSDGPSPSPSIFIPSSTLEYVAGGRTETTSRTLRYDTLKTTSDIYHSKYHSFRSGLCYSHSVSEATASKNLQVNIQSEVQSERDMCSQEKVSKTSQKPSINEVDKADGKEVTGNASSVIPTSTEASVSATATSAMETPPGASDSALREREKLGLNIDSQDTRKQEDHTDPERTNSRDTTLFGKDIIIIDVDETKL